MTLHEIVKMRHELEIRDGIAADCALKSILPQCPFGQDGASFGA